MNYLKDYEKKLEEGVEFATKLFERKLQEETYIKVVPAYVYFMKAVFDFKYQLRVLELAESNNEKMNFKPINEVGIGLNKAISALNTAHKRFGESTTISTFKTKIGGGGIDFFYKVHKAKFKKWNNKTPKEKIIKTLEVWTGRRGQDAVLETIYNLQADADLMFDYMLVMHNRQDITNATINAAYNGICVQLYKYYIRHRKKYLGTVSDKRKIKIASDVVKLALQDEYININIKFKMCDLKKFTSTVKNFVEAIDRLDVKIMSKLIFLVQEGPADDVEFRKTTKRKILEITNEIGEDIECIENPKTMIETVRGDSVDAILKTVEKFIEIEKEVEQNLADIVEYNGMHAENIKHLHEYLDILTGPDTRPCLLRIAPAVRAVIMSDPKFTAKNQKKLSPAGEKLIASLLMAN